MPNTGRVQLALAAILLLGQFQLLADESGDAILGIWHTTDDKSQVEIFKREKQYCAKVISLKEPNWPADDKAGMGGKPKNDRNNPDPKLRDRPIVGIEFMTSFVHAGKNRWIDGKIYDPEVGKAYSCKMTLVSTNKLEVRGFVGISLLGRTVEWTR